MSQCNLSAVDLAKEVFQVALARTQGKAYSHHRLSRQKFEQFLAKQLHRVREQWKSTRVARINGLRGCLRELGQAIPVGPAAAKRQAIQIIDQDDFPAGLRIVFSELLQEIADLEDRITLAERQIAALTRDNDEVALLQQVPGIGPLTSTALVACAGSPDHFKSGRHFASWLGITPLECSSGQRRWLGRITKRGDKYLRMLIIHGARSALCRAKTLAKAGKPLNRIQRWALRLEQRVGYNKATVALANKMARICWAVWKHRTDFNPGTAVS